MGCRRWHSGRTHARGIRDAASFEADAPGPRRALPVRAGREPRFHKGLVLDFGFNPPGAGLCYAFVEGVPQETRELLKADGTALLRDQAHGCDSPQNIRWSVSASHRVENLLHQPCAKIVEHDDLSAIAAVVLVAQGSCPGPAPPCDGLLHTGGDLLGAQLVVELVEDREHAFDGAARGRVIERLGSSTESGSDFIRSCLRDEWT